MAEHKFAYESLQDTSSIVELLESITDGIKKGAITLASNEDSITLTPSGLLNFTIKARQKSGESKLELRIRWKKQMAEGHQKDSPLVIGSK